MTMSETHIFWGAGARPGTKNFIKPVSSVEIVATSLPAGTQATASVEGGDESPLFRFGIPRGDQGGPGKPGRDGSNVLPTDKAIDESLRERLPVLLLEQPFTAALGHHAGVLQRPGEGVASTDGSHIAWTECTIAIKAPKGVMRFYRIPAGSLPLPPTVGRPRIDMVVVGPDGKPKLLEGVPGVNPVHPPIPPHSVPIATVKTGMSTPEVTGGLWITTAGNVVQLFSDMEQTLQEEMSGGTFIAQLPNNQLSRWDGTEWLALSKNDGSLHKVEHDDTLLGSGTDHDPLSVADPGHAAELQEVREIAEDARKEAETSQAVAQQASDVASDAQQTAAGIEAIANGAMDAANAARDTAEDAERAANEASNTATDAKTTSDGLSNRVDDIGRQADAAEKSAQDASRSAETAGKDANDAKQTAEDASKDASDAKRDAESASRDVEKAKADAEEAVARTRRIGLTRWGSFSIPTRDGLQGADGNISFPSPSFGFPPVVTVAHNGGGAGRVGFRVTGVTQNGAHVTAWTNNGNFDGSNIQCSYIAIGNWDR